MRYFSLFLVVFSVSLTGLARAQDAGVLAVRRVDPHVFERAVTPFLALSNPQESQRLILHVSPDVQGFSLSQRSADCVLAASFLPVPAVFAGEWRDILQMSWPHARSRPLLDAHHRQALSSGGVRMVTLGDTLDRSGSARDRNEIPAYIVTYFAANDVLVIVGYQGSSFECLDKGERLLSGFVPNASMFPTASEARQ